MSLILRARGGMSAIGQKNCLTLEDTDRGDQLMIDCGWALGDADNGFGKVVNGGAYPDFGGINPDRLCVVLTHGHDDHIRGVIKMAQLWPNRPITVMGSTFTIRRLDWLLGRERLSPRWGFLNWDEAAIMPVFGNFQLRPLAVHHSIPGACGVEVCWYGRDKPVRLTHLGDFAPGGWSEIYRFCKEPDYLFVDATGADKPGNTPHQSKAYSALQKLVRDADGRGGRRLIICGFSTTVERWHTIIEFAHKQAKRLAIVGSSMREMVEISADMFDSKKARAALQGNAHLADVVLATGSQAEPGSALERAVADTSSSKSLELRRGDVVVISASCIPGRRAAVGETLEQVVWSIELGRLILDVRGWSGDDRRALTEVERMLVSPSGHATLADIERTLSLIRPKCVIPISSHHGNRAIVADVAERLGYRGRLVKDGETVEL